MGVFLDKFTSNLRAIQSQQIIRILHKEREKGNITTLEEFQARLQELTTTLLSSQITPTLRLFTAEIDAVIDSETLNFMLDRIEDDLTTAFNELDTIDEVLSNHETIINDVVIKSIEIGINELDSRISSFEFLAKTGKGFSEADFNTFRIAQRIDSEANSLIVVDPKSLDGFTNAESCSVDLIGEKLILGGDLEQEIPIVKVRQVFDAQAQASELKVNAVSDISKIIDRTSGTFWTDSTLVSKSPGNTGIVTKLELDLGSIQSIDYLQIEPVLVNSVELIGIHYLDGNNVVQSILSSSIQIKQSSKLLFQTIATKKLFLTFRNTTARRVQFVSKPSSFVVQGIREALTQESLTEFMTPEIREIVTSPLLFNSLAIPTSTATEKKYWEYLIGFDNIRVGRNKYNPRGMYVSKPLTGNSIHQIGLRVLEKRPFSATPTGDVEYTEDVASAEDELYFHGSTEYYCYKLDYDADDILIHSELFPILPLGVQYIRHERLILNDRSSTSLAYNDVGFPQFYSLHNPQDIDEDIDPDAIRVYRNGTLLPSADVDSTVTDGWERFTDLVVSTPGQSNRMRYAIKIHQPSVSDIYTVSYKPVQSTTDVRFTGIADIEFDEVAGAKIVDLSGNLNVLLSQGNIVRTKSSFNSIAAVKSTVRLIVIMRRNSADVSLTPVLEEYLLVTGRGE